MGVTIELIVNGRTRTVTTDAQRPLLDVLREDLGLTGTKYGCGEGECGACAVLVDGQRTLSCRMPVGAADGKRITTIEGVGTKKTLHKVQEAFLVEDALQCGYCTSGMILTTVALLHKNPNPTDEEIVEYMNGNLCRCNGYPRILRAVRHAAASIAEKADS